MHEGKMTNADYIRSKIPLKDLVKYVEGSGCRRCKAHKLCYQTYPEGTCDDDCKKVIRQWLRREKE